MSSFHWFVLLAIGLAVVVGLCYEMCKTHKFLEAQKSRRRMWEQEHARRHAEVVRLLDEAKLQRKIAQEKEDVSPVSIPVTAAEREERRRRVRRLYHD